MRWDALTFAQYSLLHLQNKMFYAKCIILFDAVEFVSECSVKIGLGIIII